MAKTDGTGETTERRRREPKAAPARSIVRTTLAEQAYEALKERILDQTLPPGARLNIDNLSRELAVSSSPIREALARLEAERLVVSELYTGYAVAPTPSAAYLAALAEYRIVIESHCARVGAPKKKKAVLAAMRQAFEKMNAVPLLGTRYKEYRRFVEWDGKFHQVLVDSAENEVMSVTYSSLHALLIQSRLYRNREGANTALAEVMNEHRAILDAFEAGDGEAAAQAVRDHLDGGRRRLIDREIERAKG
ncbi:GntR family transcriptional regulator [Prosthecomicrobium pneumaticum]|uniref:DNA-binding GntR family transcriptional regulator n=1 Tax=Prosthecomicrobium pneumaticum TaxID=81895 RepID=A0A7W9FQB8_9HYPH|nr:GntR family transcriptional regulator [Prosthecomicrobium pneumaticum]MBB5754831.1 DNA-binding GntR family transcriptional regulator [Prosthecomicrobium pneumaticum]